MSNYVMSPKHWLVYDGKNFNDFNVYTSGEATFSSPEKNYETIEIVGRNGDLTIDYGTYKNIDVSYSCFIPYDLEKYGRAFRSFIASRHGYCRLEDTRHPDEYRMARVLNGLEVNSAKLDVGSFELMFNCKPQRYLKSGDQPITISGSDNTIVNPTYMPAKPTFIISMSSYGTIVVNDVAFYITDPGNGNCIIDFETMDAVQLDSSGEIVSWNNYVKDISNSIENLELKAGSNNISMSDGITSIEIIPRWWTL